MNLRCLALHTAFNFTPHQHKFPPQQKRLQAINLNQGGKKFPTNETQSVQNSSEKSTKNSEISQILLSRVSRNLSDRQLLKPRQRILVAVSGGQDSICLLWLLSQLQQSWEWHVGVVHCDHQWSATSSAQASHVARVAASMGYDFYQALPTRDASGETRARAWRYGVLRRIAARHAYDVVITAHTASDRVETLLHNLFRGSGLQGLQSMAWKRSLGVRIPGVVHGPWCDEGFADVSLVRPLLDSTRTELRSLRETLGLPLWPDATNFDLEINRNRIRHELLPYLRENFSAGIDRSLARWAEILHGEQSYLDSVCHSVRSKAERPHVKENGHGVQLDVSVVETLPLALQRRVLKQFIESHTGKSMGFDMIERLRLAYGQTTGGKRCLKVSLRGGFELHLQEKIMVLFKKND